MDRGFDNRRSKRSWTKQCWWEVMSTYFETGGAEIRPGLIVEIMLTNDLHRFIESDDEFSCLIIGSIQKESTEMIQMTMRDQIGLDLPANECFAITGWAQNFTLQSNSERTIHFIPLYEQSIVLTRLRVESFLHRERRMPNSVQCHPRTWVNTKRDCSRQGHHWYPKERHRRMMETELMSLMLIEWGKPQEQSKRSKDSTWPT